MKASHAILLFPVATLWLGLVHCCDEEKILECTNQFALAVGGEDASVVASEDQLDNICSSAFPVLKNCLKRSSSHCSLTIRKSFEGALNMFDFVCNDGREEAILYGDCIAQPEVMSEVKSCQTSAYLQIYSSIFESTDTCGVMDDLFDCVKNGVGGFCGEDAAVYQDKVNRIATEPLLETVGCDIEVVQTFTITTTRRPHLHRHRHHNQDATTPSPLHKHHKHHNKNKNNKNNDNNNNPFLDWGESVDGESPTTQTTATATTTTTTTASPFLDYWWNNYRNSKEKTTTTTTTTTQDYWWNDYESSNAEEDNGKDPVEEWWNQYENNNDDDDDVDDPLPCWMRSYESSNTDNKNSDPESYDWWSEYESLDVEDNGEQYLNGLSDDENPNVQDATKNNDNNPVEDYWWKEYQRSNTENETPKTTVASYNDPDWQEVQEALGILPDENFNAESQTPKTTAASYNDPDWQEVQEALGILPDENFNAESQTPKTTTVNYDDQDWWDDFDGYFDDYYDDDYYSSNNNYNNNNNNNNNPLADYRSEHENFKTESQTTQKITTALPERSDDSDTRERSNHPAVNAYAVNAMSHHSDYRLYWTENSGAPIAGGAMGLILGCALLLQWLILP